MKKNKKSPLKAKPLRYVGQSLDERLDKLIHQDVLPYILTCFFMVYFAGYEWWRYCINPDPSPRLVTFVAIIFILFSFFKVAKIFKKIKSVKLGRDGERAVGQYLESLRENGHRGRDGDALD